ncbi:pyridoxal-phosphate dependent TrpB-like enzyme [Desulfofarcimen acetoxidans DSM 771]|uniref:Tryptophan synthase beta chain n=1 Tax=Desulfofarcimen acetoxidans (strain ATCC 49208 / DSM 771 / KCTC 5769 / VKM B-1644 / 5575) TaxID=485916 RepID=C8VZ04_DESAS|nr:TrpB-like pyridoxal phosphate-dependent enzyme [Desulfofarcimen acetoxidans]ACV62914.1 pyridoxal-phosphate dependent TrpB-like enzyme [Desulfofarcimen acetoxidans DSM 771]
MSATKILLSEKEMPTRWYNIQADMPNLPKPPLNPVTKQPVGPEDLSAIFPMELIKQEVTRERWIDIPEEVQEIYHLWRPSPVMRAKQLEKALDTPAKIYFKYEGVSPAGSHKLNTAVPQAYFNMKEGIMRLATETGAGQWGVALSQACNFFGMKCLVYMVKVSYHQKPYRRSMMQIFGSNVVASPSELTEAGRKILADNPESPGSLGIAISEAVEDAAKRDDTNYALGSVLNHVLLHQTVIGLEAKEQLAKDDVYPDIVIACCGGGSNFGGMAFPFVYDKLTKGTNVRLIAAEPSACPTLTRGHFGYDYGDVAGLTPLLWMYTLGTDFMPPGIHSGGLRYHGDSPLVSQLLHDGIIEAKSFNQTSVFNAAVLFAKCMGIVPAPESSHAIQCAIEEALAAKEAGEAKTIIFNLSGHGFLDLPSYDSFMAGKLIDYPLPEEELKQSLARLPQI